VKIIREKQYAKRWLRNSGYPIKLGASTPIITLPTMAQSRDNFGVAKDDDANITNQASATLKAHLRK
jgi:hypothetical protein